MTPDTRKQTDPNASGRQTSRSYCGSVSDVCRAWYVVTLKNSVPADCTTAARHADRAAPAERRPDAASQVCSAPPAVNSTEPAKNVAASAPGPTRSTKPGNGPTRKQVDPRAKQSAIHRSGLMPPRRVVLCGGG